MSISIPSTISLSLRTDQDGVIRVGNTRVTLMTIVQRHRVGDTPEEIHDGFPTVALADIYAVIAYYLANQSELDAYIATVVATAEDNRRAHESADLNAAAFNAKLRSLRDSKRKQ